ncbi:unnamed protein product [Didymodactylos carnosus]|uniref:Uncharacterized protein n=1 Tax=Didymodactylos carnosus TaxID=1234261 RepID=A0A815P345_9BILA|nr:unnamed protein product [Didymodactylos carnosus]CAF1443505.1 unnamed protein product [Didymodactylos carnosus]CAF4166570.1 unnamed protein product [Didymodactylos carnosus]CAF4318779.1 unnamed protein product [Didymodactylos carnosus]
MHDSYILSVSSQPPTKSKPFKKKQQQHSPSTIAAIVRPHPEPIRNRPYSDCDYLPMNGNSAAKTITTTELRNSKSHEALNTNDYLVPIADPLELSLNSHKLMTNINNSHTDNDISNIPKLNESGLKYLQLSKQTPTSNYMVENGVLVNPIRPVTSPTKTYFQIDHECTNVIRDIADERKKQK